jgi:hypothetical protein
MSALLADESCLRADQNASICAGKALQSTVASVNADRRILARHASFAVSRPVRKHMCLGQPSRVPGGSILAVREMAAMFAIIRRPYGCLLYGGYIRRAELGAG